MEASRIYMSPVYDGGLSPVALEDEYGKINVWMLPFVKPVHIRKFNEDMSSLYGVDYLNGDEKKKK